MSPSNINSFVGDLVQMAKAMETLPEVQAELDRANTQIESYAKQLQQREISIIGYKEEIETLHAKVRSLEVERDDASFRVLEAEDKAHIALIAARSATASLGELIAELDPPKPEPVKEPEPQIENTDSSGWNHNIQPVQEPVFTSSGFQSSESQGQSESSPTASTGETQANVGPSPVEQKGVGSNTVGQEGGAAEPTPGPYSGKRYSDVPHYVPLQDWIAGGGTEEDYYYRPAPSIAERSY